MNCPLCKNTQDLRVVEQNRDRHYRHCPVCELIFTEPEYLPLADDEMRRYLVHENTIQNQGYVSFLNQAVEPALSLIKPNDIVLDYGCGPSPVLSQILEQHGFHCDNYDPFFSPEINSANYNLIFATETFEHFFSPKSELDRIYDLLAKGGYIVIMTEPWDTIQDFDKWYYPNDFTHVSFFNSRTFEYIANAYRLTLLPSENRRVFILQK